MDIREEVSAYAELLKAELNYSRDRMVNLSKAMGRPFTASTLAKVHIREKGGTKDYKYPFSTSTLKQIADVLRCVIRSEGKNHPKLLKSLSGQGLDLSPDHDHTDLGSTLQPEIIDEIVQRHFKVPNNDEEFISWEFSHLLELNAERIDAISSNLNWAMSQVDPILQDLQAKPEKVVRYILLSDAGASNQRLIEHAARPYGEKVRERLLILPLYSVDTLTWLKGNLFPLPVDIVIYRNTHFPSSPANKLNMAVINHDPVEDKSDPHDMKESYDRILSDHQFKRIDEWVTMVWRTLYPAS